MSCWRTLTIIASAPLISFITTACALTVDLPQTIHIASTFDDSDDVGIVDNPLIHFSASGSNDSSLLKSTLSDMEYQCVPDYGRPLPVACCFAQRDMSENTRNISWGDRSNPIAADVPLPHRISSDDATCVIILTSQNRGDVDYETASKFKEAAFTLVKECVIKHGVGGLVQGLGQNKKLAVAVVQYRHPVNCQVPPKSPYLDSNDCQEILERLPLPVGGGRVIYGSENSPYVTDPRFQLPLKFGDPNQKCIVGLTFIPNQPTDLTITTSMTEIFCAAVAIVAKCGSKGLAGQVLVGHNNSLHMGVAVFNGAGPGPGPAPTNTALPIATA